MPHENILRFEKLAQLQKCIDFPRPDQTVYDECISIVGWLHASTRDPSTCRVRAWLDGAVIGETRVLFARPDVSAFLSLPRDTPSGFRFLAQVTPPCEAPRVATIELTVSWNGAPVEYQLGKVTLRLVPAALQNRPHGEDVYPAQSTVLHREKIYGSGLPIPDPGAEMSRLILDYVSPGSSVVDFGCGAGAYGPPLLETGHQWTGLEVNSYCWELLERRGLPFRKVDWETQKFPCADQEFDEAICIEVLEHIEQPDVFLKEILRIVRKRALFSVPNMEVIPYFKDWDAVPWHLLEGDHKNFFTRTSLRTLLLRYFSRVEVFSYGEHPMRTRDGIPLHIHLWAIADV